MSTKLEHIYLKGASENDKHPEAQGNLQSFWSRVSDLMQDTEFH